MIKNIIRNFVLSLAGKKKYQSFFENLHKASLYGMNVGGGAGADISGEKITIDYIQKKLRKTENLILFDVGANVGKYANLLYETFDKNTQIYSFEPSPIAFQKLLENTENKANVKAFNFGFGEKEQIMTLYRDKDASGLASVYQRELVHHQIEMNKTEEINIKAIDSFVIEKQIDKIDLLKLDVEGHELKVLEGAKNILASGKINFIQFEFGGCNIDSRTYFRDFYNLLHKQYKIYRILKDGLQELKSYKESYETFYTTNYLAEKKP